MQESWECHKCHNVYAPNVPFCLYCWFQNQTTNNSLLKTQDSTEDIVLNDINKTSIDNKVEEEEQDLKDTQASNMTILQNKNLIIESCNIQIPVLNKSPTQPLPNKWPDTKIFLTGIGHAKDRALNRQFKIPYVLDSIMDFPAIPSALVKKYFNYMKNNCKDYLLDSGAFSYMNNPKKSLNLEELIKKYCFYINEFDITHFFELDLDLFLSLEDVENIRRRIYLETHKKPIIVFHTERGREYWTRMCKENDFIAIGGIASGKAYTPADYQQFLELCDEAHLYGTMVHGLGFTPLSLLNSHTMFFDTVDSTSWNFAKRGSTAQINEKGEIIKVPLTPFFTTVDAQENDLQAWVQFINQYYGAVRLKE